MQPKSSVNAQQHPSIRCGREIFMVIWAARRERYRNPESTRTFTGETGMFQVGENQITGGRFSPAAEMPPDSLAIAATDRRGAAMYADPQNRKRPISPVKVLIAFMEFVSSDCIAGAGRSLRRKPREFLLSSFQLRPPSRFSQSLRECTRGAVFGAAF